MTTDQYVNEQTGEVLEGEARGTAGRAEHTRAGAGARAAARPGGAHAQPRPEQLRQRLRQRPDRTGRRGHLIAFR